MLDENEKHLKASDPEIAIAQWREQLRACGIKSPQTLDELEMHLREAIEELTSLGMTEQQAFEEALQRLGKPECLIAEFNKIGGFKKIQTMKTPVRFFSLTGWLIPTAVAGIYFSRWITEIVIPTLKGGDFDRLYDSYNVAYLHATMWAILIAFAWVATIALWFAKKQIVAKG
ncbi:MAG TPA: permease prefix domain 1-containing protein [Verrucomicrobiae bacterium]|jgi:hypothetical protein|nr:permease prefix domain 1-containing protein [Verrucomicrobiae bacterium]